MYSTVGSRGPSTGRTQVSSQTSRTAVSRMCSSGSLLPLGSDQSSYLGRWTSRTSASSAGSAAVRQIAAPAARVALVLGGADSPFPHQRLLHIAQRIPGFVPAVPGPVPVRVQPPARSPVVHADIKEPAQSPLVSGVHDLDGQLHPAVQVPVHHIGAGQPDLAVVVAGAERVDP